MGVIHVQRHRDNPCDEPQRTAHSALITYVLTLGSRHRHLHRSVL
jgi:hypothetical protein